MLNVDQHTRNKERILSMIKIRGPSLPVQIARDLGVSLLFASAFLSELKDDDKLKMSSMRIGNSALYFLSGQEQMLENFINYLNQREREALALLKSEEVLEDEKLEPVVRVALRAIRDFAVPVRIRADNDAKIFWKYFALNDNEAEELIKTKLLGVKKEKKIASPAALLQPSISTSENALQNAISPQQTLPIKKEIVKVKEKKSKKEVPAPQVPLTIVPPITMQEKEQNKKSKAKKQEESEFAKSVRDYLAGKDMEILHVFNEKKKEFEGKLRIDTLFGKQEFYFVAKDKKNVNDNDFAVALQKAQSEKVPAIVFAIGEVNKKGKEYLEQWKNLVKFEKIKI